MNRSDLREVLKHPNVQAFLRLIRAGESSQDDSAYSIMFGGVHFIDFSQHPNKKNTAGEYTSTAAGAYQFLYTTWHGLVEQYGFEDFSPACQDEGAVALIAGRGALEDVINGNVRAAITKCGKEWASLPGSPYGQPTRTLDQALATYGDYSGVDTSVASVGPQVVPDNEPEKKMPFAFLAALLPSLIEVIPKLAGLFPGSEVSNRNVKAVQLAFDVAKTAVDAKNEQDLIEKLKTEPASVAIASKAVEDNWFSLAEAGGGGIAGAAQRDVAFIASKARIWDSPSFWAMAFLMPLIYWLFGGVMGLYGTMKLDPAVLASLITGAVTLILGSVAGYYFGSTTSKNKPGA